MKSPQKTKPWLYAGAALLALSASAAAWSQDKYPSKPIRIIVALGPGSGVDALARYLAAGPLRNALGTEVIVENKPGAGGILGGTFVARAKPDGYTIGMFHASVVTTATVVSPNVTYDPVKDFTPIGTLVTNPLAVVVGAKSRFQTMEQLIAEAKDPKGKVNCGLIGLGSHTHMNLELLRIASGAQINLVPFSAGTGAIITAMQGGHLDCTSLTWPAVDALVKAGTFRALAVTSRIKDHPKVPTFASKGFPQVNLEVFYAVFAPAGLPRDVTATLVPAFEKVIKDPKNEASLDKLGFEILYETPQQLGNKVKHELEVVGNLAKKIGLYKGK